MLGGEKKNSTVKTFEWRDALEEYKIEDTSFTNRSFLMNEQKSNLDLYLVSNWWEGI